MIEALLRAMKRTAKALIPLGAALGFALTFTTIILPIIFRNPLKGISVFILLIFGPLGAWAAVSPRSFFMYWERWQLVMFELTEPPEFVIALTRIGGLVVLIVSIIGLALVLARRSMTEIKPRFSFGESLQHLLGGEGRQSRAHVTRTSKLTVTRSPLYALVSRGIGLPNFSRASMRLLMRSLAIARASESVSPWVVVWRAGI